MARRHVWMMAVVVVLAIVVAENGRMCVANDNNNNNNNNNNNDQNKEDKSVMKELHDRAESWTDWARNKISGKWSTDEGGHSVERSGEPTLIMANIRGTSSEDDFEAGRANRGAREPSFRSTNGGYRYSGEQDGHDH